MTSVHHRVITRQGDTREADLIESCARGAPGAARRWSRSRDVAHAGDVTRRELTARDQHTDPRPTEARTENGARRNGRRDGLGGTREEDAPQADPTMRTDAEALEQAIPTDERTCRHRLQDEA